MLNPYNIFITFNVLASSAEKKGKDMNHPQDIAYIGTNNNPNILNIENMTDTLYSILKYSKTISFLSRKKKKNTVIFIAKAFVDDINT